MNFIPEPRQRNDIAPFGFLTLFAFPIVVTEEVMRSVLNPFFVNAPLKFTIKEVMCAIFNTFFAWVFYHRGSYAFRPQSVFC